MRLKIKEKKFLNQCRAEAIKMKADARKDLEEEVKDLAIKLAEKLIQQKMDSKSGVYLNR